MSGRKPGIQEILDALRSEPSLEAAARRLGMSTSRLRLYAYALAANGVLRIKGPRPGKCDCSRCPFRRLCGVG